MASTSSASLSRRLHSQLTLSPRSAHVVVDEAGAAVGVFAATDLFKRLDLTLSDEPSTVADFMTPVVAFGWPDMVRPLRFCRPGAALTTV